MEWLTKTGAARRVVDQDWSGTWSGWPRLERDVEWLAKTGAAGRRRYVVTTHVLAVRQRAGRWHHMTSDSPRAILWAVSLLPWCQVQSAAELTLPFIDGDSCSSQYHKDR